jgi:hypothetical protein
MWHYQDGGCLPPLARCNFVPGLSDPLHSLL